MFKKLFIIFLVIFYSGYAFSDVPNDMTRVTELLVCDPDDTPTVTPGKDDVYIKGTLEVDGAVYIDAGLDRTELTQEDAAVYNIPFRAVMAADYAALGIADSSDSGDHYISYSDGTELFLSGNSPDSDSQTDISVTQFTLPPEYVDGETVTLSMYAAYSAAPGSIATIDVSCYERQISDGSFLSGADICATAAGSLASTSGSLFNFTITPTNLAAGDDLVFKITTVFQDSDGGVGEAEIYSIQVLLDIKG